MSANNNNSETNIDDGYQKVDGKIKKGNIEKSSGPSSELQKEDPSNYLRKVWSDQHGNVMTNDWCQIDFREKNFENTVVMTDDEYLIVWDCFEKQFKIQQLKER